MGYVYISVIPCDGLLPEINLSASNWGADWPGWVNYVCLKFAILNWGCANKCITCDKCKAYYYQ